MGTFMAWCALLALLAAPFAAAALIQRVFEWAITEDES